MTLLKLAETIELSIDIPDSEKKIAAKIVMRLEKMVKKLDYFNKHLNIMYNPFKEYNTVSQESIEKYRGSIWKFIKQIKENFEKIRGIAIVVVRDMKSFSSDTHIVQLISTFTDDFGDIEDQVISLNNVLSNWNHPHFKNNVISAMEGLKKEIAEMRKLIYDRIIDHINTNILVKNWVDDVGEKMNLDLREKEPAVSRLYKEREKKLMDLI